MILKRSVSPSVMSHIKWVWDGAVNAKLARYGPVSIREPLAGPLGSEGDPRLDSYCESYGENVTSWTEWVLVGLIKTKVAKYGPVSIVPCPLGPLRRSYGESVISWTEWVLDGANRTKVAR